ncbi:rod shape-determining protein MreC [Patescibacteria group bacterium]|nr:rod shape-determining protein MreC [Patescibacteria group bacterium]MBU1895428.1 rod shape-determining protein MreC [Patescibacteria group bacterium]
MSSKLRTFINITIVVILTIVLHYVGWLRPVENIFRNMVNPASNIIYNVYVRVGDNHEHFESVDELKASYENLKLDLEARKIDLVQFELLQEENLELKKQLEYFLGNNFTHLGAQVIGKNIDPLGSTVLINRGSNNGLKIGDPVVVSQGILVGLVATVEENSAIVRLINDSQSRVAVTLLNKDRSIGLIEGGFGISVQMNFIPQNESVTIGDIVVTSGLTRDIPKGLLIGQVETITREAYQPFQNAILTPSTNLDKLFNVSVIIEPD